MRLIRSLGTIMAAVVVVAGCAQPVPPAIRPTAADREHAQAADALARWEAATESGGSAFVPVGELTSQIGDWELEVGETNKVALMAGALEVGAELPEDTPDGTVTWPDGTTTTVRTMSASDAVAAIKAAGGGCADCAPLLVVGARPGTASINTTRGPATAPSWEFELRGTHVIVTRIAVDPADSTAVTPPPWDPNDPPVGISIESATRSADGSRLTVSFVGAPDAGDQPCGAGYTGEAVESSAAVVVIVTAHGGAPGAACLLVGATRTATVDLARPLGDRAVLEVRQGLPVPVAAAP